MTLNYPFHCEGIWKKLSTSQLCNTLIHYVFKTGLYSLVSNYCSLTVTDTQTRRYHLDKDGHVTQYNIIMNTCDLNLSVCDDIITDINWENKNFILLQQNTPASTLSEEYFHSIILNLTNAGFCFPMRHQSKKAYVGKMFFEVS